MKNKVIAILLILTFALSFSGCNKKELSTAVTIGNCEVKSDVFAYYLDYSMQNKDEETYPKDFAIIDAESLVKHYVLINTAFEELGITLPSVVKLNTADEINSTWKIYGNYYKKIGVSKETFTKIKWCEAYEEELITKMFGEGGSQQVSIELQKTFFEEDYVFFKVIIEVLSGNAIEDAALVSTLEEMKGSINADNSFESISNQYADKLGIEEVDEFEISSTKEGSTDYPEEFYNQMQSANIGDVVFVKTDNYAFLAQKVDGSDKFSEYQREVLSDYAESRFEETMKEKYGDIKITPSSTVESRCYELIQTVKGK